MHRSDGNFAKNVLRNLFWIRFVNQTYSGIVFLILLVEMWPSAFCGADGTDLQNFAIPFVIGQGRPAQHFGVVHVSCAFGVAGPAL